MFDGEGNRILLLPGNNGWPKWDRRCTHACHGKVQWWEKYDDIMMSHITPVVFNAAEGMVPDDTKDRMLME